MGTEWQDMELSEACSSIDYGLTASSSDLEEGPKFLRITDIVSGHINWGDVPHVAADEATVEKYRLHNGDIVLARTGASTGSSAYVKEPPEAVFASYLVRLKAGSGFHPRFLAYYLRSPQFLGYMRGVLGDKSAQPNASASTMTKAPLRAPTDLEEQRAIAHVLGTLDDKIELNRRMNETLEGMARALFKSWFVDFDPVRAKMDGRPSGLPPDLDALFPDALVESAVGEIPVGWEVGTLDDVVLLSRDSLNPSKFPDEVFDHYSIPAYDDGQNPKAEYGVDIKSNKHIVPGDAILLSKLNPRIPRVWWPSLSTNRRSICSTEFLVARPREAWSREMLYFGFTSNAFMNSFATLITGTSGSHQRVKPRAFLDMAIVIPASRLRDAFSSMTARTISRILISREESRALAGLRDTLLPRLVSGEMSVHFLRSSKGYYR